MPLPSQARRRRKTRKKQKDMLKHQTTSQAFGVRSFRLFLCFCLLSSSFISLLLSLAVVVFSLPSLSLVGSFGRSLSTLLLASSPFAFCFPSSGSGGGVPSPPFRQPTNHANQPNPPPIASKGPKARAAAVAAVVVAAVAAVAASSLGLVGPFSKHYFFSLPRAFPPEKEFQITLLPLPLLLLAPC